MRDSKRDADIKDRLLDSVGEGEGGMIWENGIETRISKAFTLPTKVHLVKAMVFPVVMYGCESRTVKKAERQRIDAFEL